MHIHILGATCEHAEAMGLFTTSARIYPHRSYRPCANNERNGNLEDRTFCGEQCERKLTVHHSHSDLLFDFSFNLYFAINRNGNDKFLNSRKKS